MAHFAAARSSSSLLRAMREGSGGQLLAASRVKQTSSLCPVGLSSQQHATRRGFAAGAAGEEARVNCWEAPTAIAKWKEEHIVILVLSCWGVGIYGAMKAFGGGGKKAEVEAK